MKIIGIDPGLTKTGVGIIEVKGNNLYYVFSDTIYTSPNDDLSSRLSKFHNELSNIINCYKPNEAAIEETFVNKNPLSSLMLGHARGALILTLGIFNLKVKEYSTTSIKKTVVGIGRAEKEQIQSMIKILLPKSSFKTSDEADALAVAICHNNMKLRYYTKSHL